MILTQTTTTYLQTEGPSITEVGDQAMAVAATTVATMTVTEIVTGKETVTSEAGEMEVMGTRVDMIAGMAVDQEEDILSLEIAIVVTEREIAAEVVVVAIMVNRLMDKALLTVVTEQDMMIVPVDTMCK